MIDYIVSLPNQTNSRFFNCLHSFHFIPSKIVCISLFIYMLPFFLIIIVYSQTNQVCLLFLRLLGLNYSYLEWSSTVSSSIFSVVWELNICIIFFANINLSPSSLSRLTVTLYVGVLNQSFQDLNCLLSKGTLSCC